MIGAPKYCTSSDFEGNPKIPLSSSSFIRPEKSENSSRTSFSAQNIEMIGEGNVRFHLYLSPTPRYRFFF